MIVRSKAPLCLGPAGGGSDVSPYDDIYGGLTLSATISSYACCTVEETNSGRIEINAYDAQCCKSYLSMSQLEIDREVSLIEGVYNHITRNYRLEPKPFRITTYNDALVGSGLETSSTMVVYILKVSIRWLSLPLGDYETPYLAYEIERKDLGLNGGKQGQYAVALGGFSYMEFLQNDLVIASPLRMKRWIVDELESSMVPYFTGHSHSSAAIINGQRKNTGEGNQAVIEAMYRIKQSAIDTRLVLLKGDVRGFARILDEGWENKKKMIGAITSPMIQEAFDVAISTGAMVGKVSGAGGGGFIMFVVELARKEEVVRALNSLNGFVMPFQSINDGAHGWKAYSTDKVQKWT